MYSMLQGILEWHDPCTIRVNEMMESIEIIRLRTQPDVEPSVIRSLKDIIRHFNGMPGLNEARIYSHTAVPGDVSLHIMWDTVQGMLTESEIGLRIAETLAEYGILDHTVWLMKGGRALHPAVKE